LTRAEGRRFGLELAAGLAGVAAIAWWRSHELVAQVLATIAGVALVVALGAPGRLGPVRFAWMALGHALGRVVSPVFFALVYYLVLTPTGLARRTFGRSPLARDRAASTYWIARAARSPEAARASMERYF
jgi:hypothetical protein